MTADLSFCADKLDEVECFRYILIIMDDLINIVWLKLSEACTEAVIGRHPLRSCKTLGVPEMLVSDPTAQFSTGGPQGLMRLVK